MNCKVLCPLYGFSVATLGILCISFRSFVPCGMWEPRPAMFLGSLFVRSVVALIGVFVMSEAPKAPWLITFAVFATFASMMLDIHASDCSGCFDYNAMTNDDMQRVLFHDNDTTATSWDLGLLADGGWNTYLHVRDNWCTDNLVGVLKVADTMTSVEGCVVC